MWHMGDGWGWWMAFGWIWMLGFWAVVIWAVVRLTARGPGRGEERELAAEPDALGILERRYARGELSDEQFQRMRRQLDRQPDEPAA